VSGEEKASTRLLRWFHERKDTLKRLTILTHDHPDPDGLASAWVLSHLAHKLCRTRTRIAYSGVIGRGENRMMFESLGIPAHPMRKGDLDAPAIALVDTQPPFKNNQIPPNKRPDLIIDHHPLNAKTKAGLLLVDETAGATVTVLTEALLEAGISVPVRLATAVAYGIGSETQNLGRDAGARDAAVYTALLPRANLRSLWRIANPPRPASFFRTLARAIRDAFVCRTVIGVHLRELSSPDRVAQMADFLLTHEGVRWSIATGRYEGRLFVSLRTHDLRSDAGRLLKDLLGGKNRGGGHRMVAGGSVGVGKDATESDWRKVEEKLIDGFLESRRLKSATRDFPFRGGA